MKIKQIMPNPLKQRLVVFSLKGEVFDSDSVEIYECPIIGIVKRSEGNDSWTEVVPLVYDCDEYVPAYLLNQECEHLCRLGPFDESYSRSKLIAMAEYRHKQAAIIRKQYQ